MSFIQLNHGENTNELLKEGKAFLVLTQVSYRAKRTDSFSSMGLEIGESLIGDYKNIGLTRQSYRTALDKLIKWKFLTIRTTNKGTIAKIVDNSIFNINIESTNHQTNHQATIKQPSSNHQATTNNKDNKDNKEINILKENFENEIFLKLVEYNNIKQKKFETFTEKGIQSFITKLKRLGVSKEGIIEVLQQSIDKKYDGVFEVKKAIDSKEYTDDFEEIRNLYPHINKGNKEEAYKNLLNLDNEKLKKEIKLLNREVEMGKETRRIPAIHNWLKDKVYESDIIIQSKLKTIVFKIMSDKLTNKARQFVDDFGMDIFKTYRQERNKINNGITLKFTDDTGKTKFYY